MIRGEFSGDGEAIIEFELAGELQTAIIDLDFSGDLEIPKILRPRLLAQPIGSAHSLLSSGSIAEEALYLVVVPLIGETYIAEATFVDDERFRIGTGFLFHNGLVVHMDFEQKSLLLQKRDS